MPLQPAPVLAWRKAVQHLLVGCALLIATEQVSAAYPGGRTTVTNVPEIYIRLQTLAANTGYTIKTISPSPSTADSVLHVQMSGGATPGGYLAGNDDCPGANNFTSCVTIAPTTSSRQVYIIVRAYSAGTTGAMTLQITPSSGTTTTISSVPVNYGAVLDVASGLPNQAHIYSVAQTGGMSDSVVLAISGTSHGVGFDDDNGLGAMSWMHIYEACVATYCKIIVGRFAGSAAGSVSIVYDGDIHYNNCDSDGLGDSLENSPGLGTNACDNDSDDDGLSDGVEVVGVGGTVEMPFPSWGADPLSRDLFIEADYYECIPTFPGKCGPSADPAWHRLDGSTASALNTMFSPDIRVHTDIGVSNSDPGTRTIWNNLGFASMVPDPEEDGGPICDGMPAAIQGLFHHGIFKKGAAGNGPSGYCFASNHSIGVIAQEIGHNFGLQHGGNLPSGLVNCKVHYRSPMNYLYSYSLFNISDPSTLQFSRNRYPNAIVRPYALDESAGLGASDVQTMNFLESYFGLVNRTTGAVDFNRDGRIQSSGTYVRGAPTWISTDCEQSVAHSPRFYDLAMYGKHMADVTLAWLPRSSSSRLYSFYRWTSDAFPQYRYTTDLAQCEVIAQSAGEQPCNTFTPDITQLPRSIAVGAYDYAPAAAWFENTATASKLVFVYADAQHRLKYSVLSVNSSGAESWTHYGFVSSGSEVVSADPVAVNWQGVASVYASVNGVLTKWSWQPVTNSWTGPSIQQWSDGTTILVGAGIALAPGVDKAVVGTQLFAVMPSSVGAGADFARLDPTNGRWTKYPATVWPGGSAPPITSRPGLAYAPFSASNYSDGRWYLAFSYFGVPEIMMTQGNDVLGAQDRRLAFLPPVHIKNGSDVARDGLALVRDPGLDLNVRGAYVELHDEVQFMPLADGVVYTDLRDQDDYSYIRANLACSLTSTCP